MDFSLFDLAYTTMSDTGFIFPDSNGFISADWEGATTAYEDSEIPFTPVQIMASAEIVNKWGTWYIRLWSDGTCNTPRHICSLEFWTVHSNIKSIEILT